MARSPICNCSQAGRSRAGKPTGWLRRISPRKYRRGERDPAPRRRRPGKNPSSGQHEPRIAHPTQCDHSDFSEMMVAGHVQARSARTKIPANTASDNPPKRSNLLEVLTTSFGYVPKNRGRAASGSSRRRSRSEAFLNEPCGGVRAPGDKKLDLVADPITHGRHMAGRSSLAESRLVLQFLFPNSVKFNPEGRPRRHSGGTAASEHAKSHHCHSGRIPGIGHSKG